jgi:hypothetical protein
MAQFQIQPGYRFALRHDVERFSDFIVRKGATGIVTGIERDGTVIALMDEHIDGTEFWDNHVCSENDFLDDTLPLNSNSD